MTNQMRFATDLSRGILGSPDSEEMWTEIIAHIPDSVLLKPGVRILNVACGHGTEARVIARRMMALGIPKDVVNDSIYLLDKYKTFTGFVTKNLGFKNVITADFLQWETDMKFDVVIGNPPYQSNSASKGNKLWPKFILAGHDLLEEKGILAIVSPTGWAAGGINIPGGQGVIKDVFKVSQVLTINCDQITEKYFNKIGIDICYIVLQKVAVTAATRLIVENNETMVDFRDYDFISPRLNLRDIQITKKFFDPNRAKLTVEGFDRKIKRGTIDESTVPTDKFKFKHWILGGTTAGNATFTYLQFKHTPTLDYPKIVFNIGNRYWQPYYDFDGIDVAAQGYAIPLNGKESIESLTSVFEHPLFVYVSYWYQLQMKGFMKTNIVKSYPQLDLAKVWSKDELYHHFDITINEREHIESILAASKHA